MAKLSEVFVTAFGDLSGYMCVAFRRPEGKFEEVFYKYPEEADQAAEVVRSRGLSENAYFCPQLLKERKRVKSNIDLVDCVWADLDTCHPSRMRVPPSLSYETS